MLDWFWCNLDKWDYLWHPNQHNGFEWMKAIGLRTEDAPELHPYCAPDLGRWRGNAWFSEDVRKHLLPSDYGNARMAWMKKGSFYIELYDFHGLCADNSQYWKTYGTKHVCFYTKDEDFDTLRTTSRRGGASRRRGGPSTRETGKPSTCKVMFVLDPDGTSVEIRQSFTPGEY